LQRLQLKELKASWKDMRSLKDIFWVLKIIPSTLIWLLKPLSSVKLQT
jgi:hypothetical protein